MKTKLRLLSWLMMLMLSVSALGVWAQNQNPTQTVCLGTQTYSVDPVSGATFVWGISAGGTITSGNGTQNITIDWSIAGGPYTVSVYSYKAIGCPSITQSVSVTVVPQPTGPTLNVKTPNLASVCDGTNVSATFIAGSGGVGCSDAFQYRFDGVGLWVAYTPGNNLITTGHTSVDIQGQRSGCASGAGCTGTSWVTLASWTVNPNLPVSVTIIADNNPVCAGTLVTFTATPTNGGTPTYQWYNGATAVGTGLATYAYIPTVGNTDVITVKLTSSETCQSGGPATSAPVTITVNPNLPVSVTMAASANPVCAGTLVTFTATPTNGGTPTYQWYNGATAVGTGLATYAYTPTVGNTDVITVKLTSSETCQSGGPATSAPITITVNPNLPVSVTIVADNNPVCAGTSVTYTATPVNGGAIPVFAWYVNGAVQIGTSATFVYVPVDTDKVYAMLTSNATCATGSPATSNTLTMTVNTTTSISSIWHY